MDKKFVGLALIFVLAFSVFMGALVLQNPARIKAKNSRIPAKCLLFAKPILQSISANGTATATIIVSVTDSDFNIVPNKTVIVEVDFGQLDKAQTQTGDSGIAQFSLTSKTAGVSTIKAHVDSLLCEPQKGISVNFE